MPPPMWANAPSVGRGRSVIRIGIRPVVLPRPARRLARMPQ
jgi:hypothetical protein